MSTQEFPKYRGKFILKGRTAVSIRSKIIVLESFFTENDKKLLPSIIYRKELSNKLTPEHINLLQKISGLSKEQFQKIIAYYNGIHNIRNEIYRYLQKNLFMQ